MDNSFDQDRLQKLIDMLVSLLARSGVRRDNAVAAIERAYEQYADDQINDSTEDSLTRADKFLMGNLVSLWTQVPAYCDSIGESLSLVPVGPAPSFETLFALAIERTSSAVSPPTTEDASRWLLERGVMTIDNKGRYQRLLDAFPSSSSAKSQVPLLLDYLFDYVHLTAHNAVEGGGGTGLFQRVAQTEDFPLSQLPRIQQMTRKSGMDFLNLVDSFIMDGANAAADDDTAEKACVGIGVYFYVRPSEDN